MNDIYRPLFVETQISSQEILSPTSETQISVRSRLYNVVSKIILQMARIRDIDVVFSIVFYDSEEILVVVNGHTRCINNDMVIASCRDKHVRDHLTDTLWEIVR